MKKMGPQREILQSSRPVFLVVLRNINQDSIIKFILIEIIHVGVHCAFH